MTWLAPRKRRGQPILQQVTERCAGGHRAAPSLSERVPPLPLLDHLVQRLPGVALLAPTTLDLMAKVLAQPFGSLVEVEAGKLEVACDTRRVRTSPLRWHRSNK